MSKKRISRSAEFKMKVALEAVKGLKTVNEIAAEYQISPHQVSQWKQKLQREGSEVFRSQQSNEATEQAKREVALYEQIGRLKMEIEWLKKKAGG